MMTLWARCSSLVLLSSLLACDGSAPVVGTRDQALPGLRDGGAYWTMHSDAGIHPDPAAGDGGAGHSQPTPSTGLPDAGSGDAGGSLADDAGPVAADGGSAPADAGIAEPDDAPDAGLSPGADAGHGTPGGGNDDAGTSADGGNPEPDITTPGWVARRGEPCFPEGGTRCEPDQVCAPVYEGGPGVCEYPCVVPGDSCATGGTCLDFSMGGVALFACATAVGEGDACNPELLQVCADGSLCLEDTLSSHGATCRMPCACAAGSRCDASECGTSACVVLDRASGLGFCGTAVSLGEDCSPVHEARLCAGTETHDATCVSTPESPEEGFCCQRCAATSDCPAETLCLGAPDGICLPTTELQAGELCTLDSAAPAQPFVCASGLDCVRVHAAPPEGLGRCLQSCQSPGECGAGSDCFSLPTFPEAGNRCLRELPRGTRGCDPPEPLCAGDAGLCVRNPAGETQCKLRCSKESCPGPGCNCDPGETCVMGMLASESEGLCGRLADFNESCDESRDIYCAPAPGEEDLANAFAFCAGRCVMLCRYEPVDAPALELNCPAGYACREDPIGRLMPGNHICVPGAP